MFPSCKFPFIRKQWGKTVITREIHYEVRKPAIHLEFLSGQSCHMFLILFFIRFWKGGGERCFCTITNTNSPSIKRVQIKPSLFLLVELDATIVCFNCKLDYSMLEQWNGTIHKQSRNRYIWMGLLEYSSLDFHVFLNMLWNVLIFLSKTKASGLFENELVTIVVLRLQKWLVIVVVIF